MIKWREVRAPADWYIVQNALKPYAATFAGIPLSPPGAMAQRSPLQRISLILACIYLFIVLSRTFDVTLSRWRIPMAVFILMMVTAMLSGNVLQVLRSKTGIAMTAMIGWVGLATLFSTWPGGSVDAFQTSLQSFAFVVALLAVGTTTDDALRLMRTVGYATLTAALLSKLFGQYEFGRIVLYQGTYGDPNQYAMALLIGLPFWLLIAKTGAWPKKVLTFVAIPAIFFVFMRTGSRGGAIGLLAMALILFFHLSLGRKLRLLVGGAAVLIVAFMLLPPYLKARYVTIFGTDAATLEQLSESERDDLIGGAVGSSRGRLIVLMDSLEMTVQHPILGVGPKQFERIRWEKYFNRGVNAGKFVTHNAYTEMSSETGIPGLVILLAVLFFTFRTIAAALRVRKQPGYKMPEHVASAGLYLQLSLIALAVCSFFLSVAYSQMLYIFGALATIYHTGVMSEAASWRLPGTSLPEPPKKPQKPPLSMNPRSRFHAGTGSTR